MNALTLEILLRSYWSPESYVDFVGDKGLTQSEIDALKTLASAGLVTLDAQTYAESITEKGQVHIRAVLATPLPTQQWISGVPNAS